MKRNIIALLLIFVLLFAALPCAFAVNYPDKGAYAQDQASVLSEQISKELDTLNERTEKAFGGHIYVYACHFLGGMSVKEYANGLFDRWQLGDNDALLLMVIGEESYALASGQGVQKALSGENGDVLLGTYFRTKYLARSYNEALNTLLPEMASKMAAQLGADLDTSGLFGTSVVEPTKAPTTSFNWSDFVSSAFTDSSETDKQNDGIDKEEKSTGFSLKKVLLIAVILYFLFGRRKPKRRGGGRHDFHHPPHHGRRF